jgi:hypothetical protein
MSTGAAVAIVAALLIVAAAATWAVAETRRHRLRKRFGPEYERLVDSRNSRRQAEAELMERQRRVAGLGIRPLAPEARARYAGEWAAIQERFLDTPAEAVGAANVLVTSVLKDRGYPTEDHDQIEADLSVDHARALSNYHEAHKTSERAGSGSVSTEQLRQAMIHYRAMLEELLARSPAESAPGAVVNAEPADDAGSAHRSLRR